MISTGCLYTSFQNQKSDDIKASMQKLLGCGDKEKNKVNGYITVSDDYGTELCLADGTSW
jgi:hypothetical protein